MVFSLRWFKLTILYRVVQFHSNVDWARFAAWNVLQETDAWGNQVAALDRTELVSHEGGLSSFTNSEVNAAQDRDRMLMRKTEEQPVFQRRLQLFAALLEGCSLRPNAR